MCQCRIPDRNVPFILGMIKNIFYTNSKKSEHGCSKNMMYKKRTKREKEERSFIA